MKKSVVSIIAVIATVATIQTTKADTISLWNFDTLVLGPTYTNSTSINNILADVGTGTASGLHATSTVFSTPTGNGSAKSLSSTAWSVGDYYQFSLSTVGFTGITLSYDQAGSSTGPGRFILQYSTDGTSFTTFGSTNTVLASSFTSTTNNAAFNFSYNLSSVTALDNASSVYFRVVDSATTSINNGTTAAGGTDRIDNFIVSGTSAVPEPTTIALATFGGIACFVAFRRRN